MEGKPSLLTPLWPYVWLWKVKEKNHFNLRCNQQRCEKRMHIHFFGLISSCCISSSSLWLSFLLFLGCLFLAFFGSSSSLLCSSCCFSLHSASLFCSSSLLDWCLDLLLPLFWFSVGTKSFTIHNSKRMSSIVRHDITDWRISEMERIRGNSPLRDYSKR